MFYSDKRNRINFYHSIVLGRENHKSKDVNLTDTDRLIMDYMRIAYEGRFHDLHLLRDKIIGFILTNLSDEKKIKYEQIENLSFTFSKYVDFFDEQLKKNFLSRLLNRNKVYDSFRGKVRGSRIAIVGPAKTDAQNGTEIDSYDLVVRMNYGGSIQNPETEGTRCDINYFSAGQLRSLSKEKNKINNEGVQFTFLDNVSNKKKYRKLFAKPKTIESYYSNKINELCLFTNFTALPKILLHLIHFEPTELNIFNADLMLTKERKDGYVPGDWQWNNMVDEFRRICATLHEPITQFKLLKSLYLHGSFKADARLDRVMRLSTKEYVDSINQLYGSN